MKINGVAVPGQRHSEENKPCQDKIYSMKNNGVAAIALADGAGSAAFSDIGAQVAVKALCEKFCASFDEIINTANSTAAKKMILNFVITQLEDESERTHCKLKDLASTLLGAAYSESQDKVLLVHLGDGMIASFEKGNAILVSGPDNGEHKNETVFTTSFNALQRMRIARGRAEGLEGFALMSDGTDWTLYSRSEKKFIPLLNDIFRDSVIYSEEVNNLDLQELFEEIISRKSDDDCSLIVMCRPDKNFRGYRDLDEAEQFSFLGIKSGNRKSKDTCEKFFDIFESEESLTRADVIRTSKKLGFKHKKILGLLRRLNREGFIEKMPDGYSLNFNY